MSENEADLAQHPSTVAQHPLMDSVALAEAAEELLRANDRGEYTVPAPDLYPHQWLWDSAFISIGIAHYDIERAKTEILHLLGGQWSNGMMPHMIFSTDPAYRAERNIWRSWINPNAPEDASTSGITQPPVLAEAIVRIGEHLPLSERRQWYKQVYPSLLAYHQWLYAERDPHQEGLVLQIHPWETGLDNTPPWMAEMREHLLPWWVRGLQVTKLSGLVRFLRRDTRKISPAQRFTSTEVLALFDTQKRLRRKSYDIHRILNRSLFTIEDLSFNSMFIRANEHLASIAKTLHEELPEELVANMARTREALELLWDDQSQQYYSRDFVTHRLLRTPSVATLMPLYAGSVTPERAARIVKLIENDHIFGTAYPTPTVPLSSDWFDENRYWQGPSWVNINWMIIDGLRRYGYIDHAEALRETTIEMVGHNGFYEYFNPLTGAPLGSEDFSWTAALTLDLLHRPIK